MRLGVWMLALVWSGVALAGDDAQESAAAEVVAEPKKPSNITQQISVDAEVRRWVRPERVDGFPDEPVFNYLEQVGRIIGTVGVQGVGPGELSLFFQGDQVLLADNRFLLDGEVQIERQLLGSGLDPCLGSVCFPNDTYATLEKLHARYRQPGFEVTLGDFYAAFGRGGALNLNRNVDIDVDTSIAGAKLVMQPGMWDVQVVAGQLNRQQIWQDNPNVLLQPDLRHLVYGARAELYGLGPINLGVHGTAFDFVQTPGLVPAGEYGAPDAVVAGATVEAFGVAGIDWYLEQDLFFHPTDLIPMPNNDSRVGSGTYLSGIAYTGDVTVQFEAKAYYDAERMNLVLTPEQYEAVILPTLEYERAITEDSAAALNSQEIYGGLVRVDWAPSSSTVPFVSLAVLRDLDTETALHFNTVPETIVHGLVGGEFIYDKQALLGALGVRHDLRDDLERNGFDRQIHGDIAWKHEFTTVEGIGPITGNLNLSAEHYSWGNNPIQQTDYAEIEGAYTVNLGPKIAATWYVDFSSNPLITSKGNIDGEDWYTAGELQYKPVPAWTFRAFYGAYKAGIRCSGGQCRLLPGFEGFRFAATGAF